MHDAEHVRPLERMELPRPLMLSVLWGSVTLCYLYGDYFGLYVPERSSSSSMGEWDHSAP